MNERYMTITPWPDTQENSGQKLLDYNACSWWTRRRGSRRWLPLFEGTPRKTCVCGHVGQSMTSPVLLYVHSTYIVGRSHWFHWKAYSLVWFAIIQWVLDYWNDHVQKKFPDNRGIPLNDILFRFSALGFMFWPITSKILLNEKKGISKWTRIYEWLCQPCIR